MAAMVALPRTLALMPLEKKTIIVRPQWPLCTWPGQCSVLALNYSHLNAQWLLIVTSVSLRFVQVESHHQDDLT